jgi:hypothetical protein
MKVAGWLFPEADVISTNKRQRWPAGLFKLSKTED